MKTIEVSPKVIEIIKSGKVANVFKANKFKETQELTIGSEVDVSGIHCVITNLDRSRNNGASTLFFLRSKESIDAKHAKSEESKRIKEQKKAESAIKKQEEKALKEAEKFKKEKEREAKAVEREERRLRVLQERREASNIKKQIFKHNNFVNAPKIQEKRRETIVWKIKDQPCYGDPNSIYITSLRDIEYYSGRIIVYSRNVNHYPYYSQLNVRDVVNLVTDGESFPCVVQSVKINGDNFSISVVNPNPDDDLREGNKRVDCTHRYGSPKRGPWKNSYMGLYWQDMPTNDADTQKLLFALFRKGLLYVEDFLSDAELEVMEHEDLKSVDVSNLSKRARFIHTLKLQHYEKLHENSNN